MRTETLIDQSQHKNSFFNILLTSDISDFDQGITFLEETKPVQKIMDLEQSVAYWPKSIREQYDPVKALGKGGFASVVLAKPNKQSTQTTITSPSEGPKKKKKEQTKPSLVAVKLVRRDPKFGFAYAKREIQILRLLPHHPNIVRIYHAFVPLDGKSNQSSGAAAMVLQYCQGVSLARILEKEGTPSLACCRILTAQLVDSVQWLHSHAVLHRDIQPANLMITGYSSTDEEATRNDHASEKQQEQSKNEDVDWGRLLTKWRLTLVDFGFARNLLPSDILNNDNNDKGQAGLNYSRSSIELISNSSSSRHFMAKKLSTLSLAEPMEEHDPASKKKDSPSGDPIGNSSSHRLSSSLHRRLNGSIHGKGLNRSVSKYIVRSLSALGHADYAAPEVKKCTHQDSASTITDSSSMGSPHSIAEYVSDYGMTADAYSVGATIRHLMTGVPPKESVAQAIASQQSIGARAGRWLQRKAAAGKKKKNGSQAGADTAGKKKRYRIHLPLEVVRLVKGMTDALPEQRTTVRAARLYPWVDDILEQELQSQSSRGGVHSSVHPFRRRLKFLDIPVAPSDGPVEF